MLVFGQETAAPSSNENYAICFCTTEGHAYVVLFDSSTGEHHGRGLYATGYGTNKQAPKVPHAGELGEKSSEETTSDSSSGSSSSSSSSSSDSSGISGAIDVISGPGTIQDDDGIAASKCLCVKISKENYNKAADYINSYPRTYRLLSQNCVDFVEDVASHLGIDLPDADTLGLVSEPSEFYNNMNKWKKDWETDPPADRFIDYGRNATEKVKQWFGMAEQKDVLNVEEKNETNETNKTSFSSCVTQRRAEDFLNNPDELFALVSDIKRPKLTSLTANVDGYSESCGFNCIKIDPNTELAFFMNFEPYVHSLTWWDFGEGAKVVGSSANYKYSKEGKYTVISKYLDEQKEIKYGIYTILVEDIEPIIIPNVSTSTGKKISVSKPPKKIQDAERLVDKYKNQTEKLPDYAKNLLGTEVIRIYVTLEDNETAVATLKTDDGDITEAQVIGIVDAANKELIEKNRELIINDEKITYTAELYTDQKTIEKTVLSKDPEKEFLDAWNKDIRYQSLTVEGWFKSLFANIMFTLWSLFTPDTVSTSAKTHCPLEEAISDQCFSESRTSSANYPLNGSFSEICDEMDAKGPDGHAAETTCRYTWNYCITFEPKADREKCNCNCTAKIRNITVTASISQNLPEWDPAAHNATEKQIAAWNTFLTNLQKHEDNHKKMYEDGKAEIEAAIDSLTTSTVAGTCREACEAARDSLNTDISNKGNNAIDKIDEKQDKYDSDTEHGKTEGTLLDCSDP